MAITDVEVGTQGILRFDDDGEAYVTVSFRLKKTGVTPTTIKWTAKSPYGSSSGSFLYSENGSWKVIKAFKCPREGFLTFNMAKTGIPEYGGPKTVNHELSRSKGDQPPPPLITRIRMMTKNTAEVRYKWMGSAGYVVEKYQVAYSRDPEKIGTIVNVAGKSGIATVPGLLEGEIYYLRMRTIIRKKENKKTTYATGVWSDAEQRRGVLTAGGALVKHNNEWRYAVPYMKINGVWKRVITYVKRSGVWIISM